MTDYNYVHFEMGSERHKFDDFANVLHVGQRAPDFALQDLDSGDTVQMKDLWSQGLVVAEFGSFT